jgi:hypothetical protein
MAKKNIVGRSYDETCISCGDRFSDIARTNKCMPCHYNVQGNDPDNQDLKRDSISFMERPLGERFAFLEELEEMS